MWLITVFSFLPRTGPTATISWLPSKAVERRWTCGRSKVPRYNRSIRTRLTSPRYSCPPKWTFPDHSRRVRARHRESACVVFLVNSTASTFVYASYHHTTVTVSNGSVRSNIAACGERRATIDSECNNAFTSVYFPPDLKRTVKLLQNFQPSLRRQTYMISVL